MGQNFQTYTEEIWDWIKDDKVSTIGVWGIGGSGKTALADHMYDELLEEGDTKVIWVTVSQNSISHLQQVIAEQIELNISGILEVKVSARKLRQAFKVMKKCVIILDDVWDHFFLKEVGFPISDNRVKLILTTRIWDVCQGMDCEEYTIKVEPLDEEDSCALFEKAMGLFYEGLSWQVKNIVDSVPCECEGLPLAIVRIAESMKKKKEAREWSHMLKCLENLGNGQYEIVKWVLPVLRSSYDFLTTKLQRLFLYCALSMGVDDDVLLRRFVYASIDETKKLSVQYNEGHNMLDRLKNHSMLEHCGGNHLKVNTFLRLLAISIAEDTGTIMANASKALAEIPSDHQWREDLQEVFLSKNNIKTIPYGICIQCSQLSTLLLDGNKYLDYISDDFFNNMPALKVLDLSKTRIKRLPGSISNLKCLNALLLSKCKELSYIPSLSKLKLLISLDLYDTAITEAPMGLESCVNLRCLNVLYTYMLMPSSLISKLVNLELLLGPKVTGATGADIQNLHKLEFIIAYFDDLSAYVSFLGRIDIRSFLLILADATVRYDHDKELRTRRAYYSDSIKTMRVGSIVFENIKAVLPGWTVGSSLCSVVSSLARNYDNPPHIKQLVIKRCSGAEYLFCFSRYCRFCSSYQLVGSLHLAVLYDLKYIVSPNTNPSRLQRSLFSHLTDLIIEDCDSMESLISPKLLEQLQNLRTIQVSRCDKMKEIFVGEDDCDRMMEDTPSGSPIDVVNSSIPEPTITLPNLTSLTLGKMRRLEFVCRSLLLFPSLQTFSASGCSKLVHAQIQISNGRELLPINSTATGKYFWPVKTN